MKTPISRTNYPPPPQIRDLIHQIHFGEPAAWNNLLHLVQGRLEKLIRAMFRDFPALRRYVEWDDVYQNVLLRLFRALKEVAPASVQEFFALAASLARRDLLDLTRSSKKSARNQDCLGQACLEDIPIPEPGADELDNWSLFHEQVEKLPVLEREIVSLLYYHGWTQRQVAELFQVAVRTVRRHERSAQRKLARALWE